MNPTETPLGRTLFTVWIKTRGNLRKLSRRPFSRHWEEFLELHQFHSAIERNDAERDLRQLEADHWIDLKSVPRRPHLIERIIIPLSEENRWKTIFNFTPPSHEEADQIQSFGWHPTLEFIPEARLNLTFRELQKIDHFLKTTPRSVEIIPIKERSLQLFGDEKRLDLLSASSLFRHDRLQLERDLKCEIVGVPLAWKRGPIQAHEKPVIILENAATWHSYARWNQNVHLFSAVVYGEGNRFIEGVRSLSDLFHELHGSRKLLYFGDLDPQGLIIPQEASLRASELGLPLIQPHLWSYQKLLQTGIRQPQPWKGELPPASLYDWIHPHEENVEELIHSGHRLAQEAIGWEFLSNFTDDF